MSIRPFLRAALYWHTRKGRRVFDLLDTRLSAPSALRRTGVRWG